MNRKDFYFRQRVTEAELDAAFQDAEDADRKLAYDHAYGVVSGAGVSQKAGSPNISVDVAGPAVIYDKLGQRINFGSGQNVDLTVDSLGVSTAVAGGANSKIVSVYAKFTRSLTDPRVDGNGATVYHSRAESFSFVVKQGTEAVSPTPPALDSEYILLADVTRTFGQTSIVNANISTTRREHWAPQILGGTYTLTDPKVNGQLAQLLTILNTKGIANGFASLDGSGKVPTAQLSNLFADIAMFADNGNTGSLPGNGSRSGTIYSADPGGTYTNTGVSVSLPNAVSGDKILVISAHLIDRLSTWSTIRLAYTENGGADTQLGDTEQYVATSSIPLAHQVAMALHTVGTGGTFIAKSQVKTTSGSGNTRVYEAYMLAMRLKP